MTDEAFRALSKAPRREILAAVARHDGPIPLDSSGEETIIDDSRWEEHQIALYHSHLPTLDDYGFVQWDRENQVVTEGERFEEIRPLLDPTDADADDGEEFSCHSSR